MNAPDCRSGPLEAQWFESIPAHADVKRLPVTDLPPFLRRMAAWFDSRRKRGDSASAGARVGQLTGVGGGPQHRRGPVRSRGPTPAACSRCGRGGEALAGIQYPAQYLARPESRRVTFARKIFALIVQKYSTRDPTPPPGLQPRATKPRLTAGHTSTNTANSRPAARIPPRIRGGRYAQAQYRHHGAQRP